MGPMRYRMKSEWQALFEPGRARRALSRAFVAALLVAYHPLPGAQPAGAADAPPLVMFMEHEALADRPSLSADAAVILEAIRSDPARYIGADIVEKVLLRDVPSLYGIQDVQELNALFMTLAYNTAREVSLDALSQQSGVSKPTVRRYLEYLEAAFLIKVVHRVDRNARRFKRAHAFKVYVTTPALRCALFGPVSEGDEEMGPVAETAVFAQWFHAQGSLPLHYARWGRSEVDIVHVGPGQAPDRCVEVKWSDRPVSRPGELKGLFALAKRYPGMRASVTTRTLAGSTHAWPGTEPLAFIPTSLYCYAAGRELTR